LPIRCVFIVSLSDLNRVTDALEAAFFFTTSPDTIEFMVRIHKYPPLLRGELIKRYKRFLADVRLTDGSEVTAFCPNSGSMKGMRTPGMPVMLSLSDDPKRKTAHTLEMIRPARSWVGVNTHLTNKLAWEVLSMGLIKGISPVRAEVTVGSSRLDILATTDMGEDFYIEVKSVTLKEGSQARFPDAVTTRGAKHMRALEALVMGGKQAAVMFMVQRADCDCFAPEVTIDPAYAKALAQAQAMGVKTFVVGLSIRAGGVYLRDMLPQCVK
jgi:sugar fermentation stimulation protein A